MDAERFGAWTRQLASAGGRRGVVRVLGVGLLAALGSGVTAGTEALAAVEEENFGFCKLPKQPCGKPRQCCSGKCKKGVCGCNGRGAPCINRVGLVCCSQKCRKGKCL